MTLFCGVVLIALVGLTKLVVGNSLESWLRSANVLADQVEGQHGFS